MSVGTEMFPAVITIIITTSTIIILLISRQDRLTSCPEYESIFLIRLRQNCVFERLFYPLIKRCSSILGENV